MIKTPKNATQMLISFVHENHDQIAEYFERCDDTINKTDFIYHLQDCLGINHDTILNENFAQLSSPLQYLIYEAFWSSDLDKVFKTFKKLVKS